MEGYVLSPIDLTVRTNGVSLVYFQRVGIIAGVCELTVS